MTLKKLCFVLGCVWICAAAVAQQSYALCSDSVKLNLQNSSDGELTFTVQYRGSEIISPSPLGLNVDHRHLGRHVESSEVASKDSVTTTYLVKTRDSEQYLLDARVYNNGIALRYRMATVLPRTIYGEATAFTFPSQTRAWYASGPFQYGWLQEYQDRVTDSLDGELLAPAATFILPNGTHAALTEVNLFNYHGAVMLGETDNRVRFGYVDNRGHIETGLATGLPPTQYWHEQVRDVAWIAEPANGYITTPWRLLMIGRDLSTLVNNDLVEKLSDKPDAKLFPNGANSDWIRRGRSVFTWLTEGGAERLSLETHRRYVRGASELGLESVVVDDGWELWATTEREANGRDKWQMLAELTNYARERHVDIWVWRASSPRFGNRDDIGLVDPRERANFMKKCAEIGVKGLKIDFFHTENLFTVRLMEEILKEAARNKLMVIFHGVNKPTGDSYTYPNLLAKEAVRGLECVGGENSWAPGPSWPYHNTVLPFTRWLIGAADYTPLNFRGFCHPSVTFAHQLSSIYMFTSPMLILAADMDDMLGCKARGFIESVPVKWDRSVVLPQSRIGELAALARCADGVWYLTVLNGDSARVFETTLDFLPKGEYRIEMVVDTPDNRRELLLRDLKRVRSGDKLTEPLLSGGGLVARITPVSR